MPCDGDMPEKPTFIQKPFDNQMLSACLRDTLAEGKKPEPLKRSV
jgi:hypothetical protein|tara:strand:- start:3649 stop:3783 length:135 start_codon:yes stop_codon:yes gene_type:complete